MSQPTSERLEFKSELRRVLHLITHSLYSHREVFLRELISNACDAIDKVRFNSLQNPALVEGDADWKIKLVADKAAGTLTITDNGIGMDRDAIVENLGTIAKSGTQAFMESLKTAESKPDLIGQFGVGFYAAFMVADLVTVTSRLAGTPASAAVKWTSDGQGDFTVESAEKATRGTEIVLHLKEDAREFLDEWRLRQVVKQFSDFVEHPVVMDVEKKGEGDEKTIEEETLNSRKALWLRSKSDISTEEYEAFYHQISNDFDQPLKVIHYSGEGTVEFKALLYLPKRRAFDLQFGDVKAGPRLYINRVQIMDHCEALLPAYLRFVKGVVDCPDLPLNVSREMLQNNPLLEKIQKVLVKTVLKTLEELKHSDFEAYAEFHRELGGILKEGLSRDWSHREQLADLLLFESLKTERGKFISLGQYVEQMPADQTEIHYLTGEHRATLEHAPCLELFRHRGWDVLLLTDPIDEFVIPALPEYKGKPLKAADRSQPELKPEEEKLVEEIESSYKPLLGALAPRLEEVQEIRISRRLKESAACLVSGEGDMGANLERLMQKLGRGEGPSKRILELNPDHAVVKGMRQIFEKDPADPRLESYGRLLYEQAVISEGSRLEDPSAFIRRINELMAKDAGA
jgi:molecular chaperone HtpG